MVPSFRIPPLVPPESSPSARMTMAAMRLSSALCRPQGDAAQMDEAARDHGVLDEPLPPAADPLCSLQTRHCFVNQINRAVPCEPCYDAQFLGVPGPAADARTSTHPAILCDDADGTYWRPPWAFCNVIPMSDNF